MPFLTPKLLTDRLIYKEYLLTESCKTDTQIDCCGRFACAAFQGRKKPLSHHEDVIGAEIEKAR